MLDALKWEYRGTDHDIMLQNKFFERMRCDNNSTVGSQWGKDLESANNKKMEESLSKWVLDTFEFTFLRVVSRALSEVGSMEEGGQAVSGLHLEKYKSMLDETATQGLFKQAFDIIINELDHVTSNYSEGNGKKIEDYLDVSKYIRGKSGVENENRDSRSNSRCSSSRSERYHSDSSGTDRSGGSGCYSRGTENSFCDSCISFHYNDFGNRSHRGSSAGSHSGSEHSNRNSRRGLIRSFINSGRNSLIMEGSQKEDEDKVSESGSGSQKSYEASPVLSEEEEDSELESGSYHGSGSDARSHSGSEYIRSSRKSSRLSRSGSGRKSILDEEGSDAGKQSRNSGDQDSRRSFADSNIRRSLQGGSPSGSGGEGTDDEAYKDKDEGKGSLFASEHQHSSNASESPKLSLKDSGSLLGLGDEPSKDIREYSAKNSFVDSLLSSKHQHSSNASESPKLSLKDSGSLLGLGDEPSKDIREYSAKNSFVESDYLQGHKDSLRDSKHSNSDEELFKGSDRASQNSAESGSEEENKEDKEEENIDSMIEGKENENVIEKTRGEIKKKELCNI